LGFLLLIMARKVFQNDDLLRRIYGYGDSNHRLLMSRICREINDPILSKVPDTYPSMKNKLIEFFRLHRCKCCTRHCHNRPKLWIESRHNVPWLFVDRQKVVLPECKDLGDCDCDCRREMRKIHKFISHYGGLNTYWV